MIASEITGSWAVVVELASALAWPAAAVVIAVLVYRVIKHDPPHTDTAETELTVKGWGFKRRIAYRDISEQSRVVEVEQPRGEGRQIVGEVLDLY